MGESRVTEVRPVELGEAPTVEVRVYRRGVLIARELCESDEQAALAIDEWNDVKGVECEVADMSSMAPGGSDEITVFGRADDAEMYPSGAGLVDRGGRQP